MSRFDFDVHGLVRGRVEGPDGLVEPVRRELGYFAREDLQAETLDLVVRLGSAGMAGDRVWTGSHLGARWTAAVVSEQPLTLEIHANWLTRFVISKWLVEPAVRVAAQHRGAVMAHAAGISDGQSGLLVAGAGGAGKTTWTLGWIERGHPYLSDDFSVISENNLKHYPTLLRVGGSNLLVNSVISGLSARDKMEIWIRTLARRLSLGSLKLYFKQSPQYLIPNIKMSPDVELAGAVWLAAPGSESPLPRRITPMEMATRMAGVDQAEAHGFGGAWLGREFWEDHRRMLAGALADKPCMVVAGQSVPPPAGSIEELLGKILRP